MVFSRLTANKVFWLRMQIFRNFLLVANDDDNGGNGDDGHDNDDDDDSSWRVFVNNIWQH